MFWLVWVAVLQNSKVLGNGRSNGINSGLVAPRAPKRTAAAIDATDAIHESSNRSRHAGNNDRALAAATTPAFSRPGRVTAAAMFCEFHQSSAHNTKDCRAASAAAMGTVCKERTNNRKCYKCHVVGWTPNHQCNTAQRSSPLGNSQELHLGAMSWDADSTPVEKGNNLGSSSSLSPSSSCAESSSHSVVSTTSAELQAAYNAGLTDATADIGRMQISDDADAMIAYHAQQCKYHNIYSVPP